MTFFGSFTSYRRPTENPTKHKNYPHYRIRLDWEFRVCLLRGWSHRRSALNDLGSTLHPLPFRVLPHPTSKIPPRTCWNSKNMQRPLALTLVGMPGGIVGKEGAEIGFAGALAHPPRDQRKDAFEQRTPDTRHHCISWKAIKTTFLDDLI